MDNTDVEIRPIPYPYQAMLVICSDLDETPDRRVYWEIMRFLNTTDETAMGPGLGLEVGNSIYFDMPPDQFAYWNTDDAGRAMVRTLIQSGHIDCLHSYGDLATRREYAGRALDELSRHDCRLEVWIDHGTAPSNFGADIMRGSGDVPGSEAYHADLTCDYGVQYVWRGRVTSVIGQNVQSSLGQIFTARHPLISAQTIAKEAVKGVLGRLGSAKYEMHGRNRVLRRCCLRDGTPVYEFLRSNPHWGGVSSCETGRDVGEWLTGRFLDRLAQRGGVCILYTHLGKIRDPHVPFDKRAVAAFKRLAQACGDGRILVTTTRRALGCCRAVQELEWTTTTDQQGLRIDLATKPRMPAHNGELSIDDLDGLTFYVPDPDRARVVLNGQEVRDLSRNAPDHTGRRSVSISWRSLEFPEM